MQVGGIKLLKCNISYTIQFIVGRTIFKISAAPWVQTGIKVALIIFSHP